MALSLRVKNLLFGGGLAAFAGSVFAYTMHQMSKVRGSRQYAACCAWSKANWIGLCLILWQDDFDDLDEIAKVNVHQSGAMKATPVKKD